MDRWSSLKFEMEEALEMGNVLQACFRLDAISKAAPSPGELHGLLANHTLKDLPTLHYLARYRFRKVDRFNLGRIIKILTRYGGYDINRTVDRPCDRKQESVGFTALLASVEQKNPIFVECLLRRGARADIRDQRGFTPCHWAIIVGDVECLEKLVQFGGSSVLESSSIETSGELGIHPLLHTAVDLHQEEFVEYLTSLGVNVNEEAVYKGCPSSDPSQLEEIDQLFTPLDRAIRQRSVPIITVLLKDPRIKLSGLEQLHFCLTRGYTDIAKILLDWFSNEELASDKIQGQWALHCLPPVILQWKYRGKYLRDIILKYVGSGWNINSMSEFLVMREITLLDKKNVVVFLKCTLLHLACFYKAHMGIFKLLLEAGADVNRKTEGDVELTPIQILVNLEEWESAGYLMDNGADLNVRGSFKDLPFNFTQFMRKNLSTGILELNSTFSSVELLVKMGSREGLPFLDKVLSRSDVVWHGANEFHLAVESNNPAYILKVARHCAKIISKDDLHFITYVDDNLSAVPCRIPCLFWLLRNFQKSRRYDRYPVLWHVHELAELIKYLVGTLDYDLDLCKGPHKQFIEYPMLFFILEIDFHSNSSNHLLRTVLQLDHFRIDVGGNTCPVQFIMHNWRYWCHNKVLPKNAEAVKLLVNHGMDCSEMVINRHFPYTLGCSGIIKMLYCAGAKILDEFFPVIPTGDSPERRELAREIKELKTWKDAFDQDTDIHLKHICRLRLRKMLKCIGDLKMLDHLPATLKEDVLCNNFF